MDKQKIVYVILEDWNRDWGESGINTTIFSTYQKAKQYYNELKEIYKNDYSDNDTIEYNEDINDNTGYINFEGNDEYSSDYFTISCNKKIVDEIEED